ncbi:MAG: 7-cyano-7-deazaguanine synthase QueC [Maricaulaceae bacterium]|jgi:7-cyano-7-deazaguanine synthase
MTRNTLLDPNAALVLFSGGQDSATCLAWALERYARVETIGFDYGQRHAVELTARQAVRDQLTAAFPAWGEKLGPDVQVDLSGYGALAESALTASQEIAFAETGLPTTFVPGRNLVFFSVAGAHAYRRGLGRLAGGMCETDYSGYPDCRAETIEAMGKTLAAGLDAEIAIDTPLMHLTKAETWGLAEALGGEGLVELILEQTHTCYLGDRGKRHAWGYGCGTCPACALRAKGWAEWAGERVE